MTDLSPRLAALSAEQRAQLARLLRERAQREQAATIPRRPPQQDVAPCSWMQRGLWLLDQLQPGPAYNLISSIRLRGRLDPAVLERAVNETVRRHEVLRTTFHPGDGEPMQRIASELYVPIAMIDASAVPHEARDAETQRRATHEAQRPFDLASGPLLRPSLIRFDDTDWRFILAIHHIVADAWGMGLLYGEVLTLYEAFSNGRPSPLPELPIQYADYAVWQRTTHSQEAIARDLEYWKGQLSNAPSTELPTDKIRPSARRFRGSRLQIRLPATLVEQLTALSRREETTLYMVLLAGFQALLARYTGQDDVVVGSPMVDRRHAETHGLIGFFLNTLVMRTDLSGDPTFRELLRRVRRVALDAYEHQSTPFDQIVKVLQPTRDASRTPLFQIMFTFHDALPGPVAVPGLEPESEDVESGMTQFDLTVMLQQAGDSVAGTVEFDTDLFERSTIERLVGHLEKLLEGIAADPERRLSELPLMSEAERQRLLVEWNRTERPYPTDETLPSLFAQQVTRTPEAVAVVYGDERLTFQELDARANRLAHHLRAFGVGPDWLVGVYLDRSPELVVALLAILKAGGAYVPLDPTYPPERLRLMAEDAGLTVLVTHSALSGRFPGHDATVVCVDADAARIAEQSADSPELSATAGHLAYVIYTSGSTGRPKGVMLPHGAVVNTLLWLQEAFPLSADDTVAQKTASSFTDSVWELFWPLLVGAKLSILPDEVVRDPALLHRALDEQRVTVTQFVPPQLSAFLEWLAAVDAADPLPSLRWIFNGGEALPPRLARAWYARFRRAKIANIYGMTESAIYGTCAIVEPAPDGAEPQVLVGRPIANATAYVLDQWGQPCPPGMPGEIHLGGRGLARGYLNLSDLTAERFIPDPFGPNAEARLYKTGDLGRYLPDGRIEYLGRIDDQVKIRGFRVEPGEIEAILRTHPAIHEAVVVAREDRPGQRRLVAYVVPTDSVLPPSDEIGAHLRQGLPEYMVPSAYVVLDLLPLTPSGKVDRRALPAPDTALTDSAAEYVAPSTPAEEMLAGIWAELLGLERVGIHDNFFALGGDSILSMRVVARARTVGLELNPALLFQHQTIAELAPMMAPAVSAEATPKAETLPFVLDTHLREVILARLSEGARQPLDPSMLEDVYPLGPLQQGLLYHTLADADSTVYVEQLAWSFRGALDPEAYRQAWQGTVDRHAVLRTGFIWDGLDVSVQAVLRRATLPFRAEDWRGFDAAEQPEHLERLRAEERRNGFDLAAVPLTRLVVVRLGDDRWACVWTFHHLLLDGWSVSLLLGEVFARYQAARDGRVPELADAAPYGDYIDWLRNQDPTRAERYWRSALSGLTGPTMLPVGTTSVGPVATSSEPAEHLSWVPEQTVEALQALARRERLTLNTILQGVWALLLSRYSGDEDVVFGATASVRPPELPNVEGMLGLLINTLPVRVQVPADATVVPWLRALQAQQAEARDYSWSLLTDIQGWSDVPRGEPLFESLLIVENFPIDAVSKEAASLDVVVDDGRYTTQSSLPLNLMVHPGARLLLRLLYDPSRFDAGTIERLAGHLGVLLEGIAAEPGRRLSELPLLSEAERQLVVDAWNRTARPYEAAATVPVLFERQAAATPEAVAFVDGERALSYRDLNARANQLAARLRQLGVGPGALVGVCVDRSAGLVVALLGILKAGAAYLPLDPAYPAERLAFMLDDANARALVTTQALAAHVSSGSAAVVRLDADAATIARQAATDLPPLAAADDLAYVIYTSGSTGRPKGVMLEHRNVVSFFAGMDHALAADRPGVWLAVTSVSFDISVLELLWTLCRGFRVVLQPELRDLAGRGTDGSVAAQVARHGVTHLQCTPSLARLVAEDPDGLAALRSVQTLLLGGEALPAELAARLLGDGDGLTLLNMYGPTETTVWSAVHRLTSPIEAPVPIGRPIANTRVYVLDGRGQPQPIGVPGELWIGGAGVARGYLGRPDLTAERFVPDPFGADPTARLYRTGDLARWRPDGVLEYLGRTDQQVKLRGFRIELGEVEAALRAHPAIHESVVVVREDRPGDPRLVAYLVGADGTTPPAPDALRSLLSERLPEYMLPAAFVTLEALPLTPNGKLDRRALPPPDGVAADVAQAYHAPQTATEELVAGIWAEVLGIERVGIRDNFFDLGGHSLLATRVLARVRQTLGIELSLRDVMESRTLEVLTGRVDAARGTAAGRADVPLIATSRAEPSPLSFAQERLWVLDQLEGGSPRYNLPGALRLRGHLDEGALERALQALVVRHEALRTTVSVQDSEPVQVVAPTLELTPAWHDLRSLPAAEQADGLTHRLEIEALRPFNLATGPLIRASVLQLADEEHVLTLTLHHIIADGWSLGVLWRDLTKLYAAEVQGRPLVLEPLPLQYADYTVWQRAWLSGERLEGQLAYWRDKLAGAPTRLELPTDRPRPAIQDYRGAAVPLRLGSELVRALQRLGASHQATLYMVLLAAFQTLLHRYTGQDDLLVGTPTAGRSQVELENLVGLFVNTLVLRGDLSGDPSFAELLDRTRETTLDADAHQDLPFERLVNELKLERDLSINPLVQVFFIMQNLPRHEGDLVGLEIEAVEIEAATAKVDLTLVLQETPDGLEGGLEYDTALFDAGTIERLAGHLGVLLEGIAAEPGRRLSELPLLSEAERQLVVDAWNRTARPYEAAATVPVLFERQAAATPEAVALVDGDRALSYRDLNARANQLAARLRELGVGPGALVGVCVDRSAGLVVALLGILKAGAAYLPLDPAYPAERLAFMLDDANARALVTTQALAAHVSSGSAAVVRLDADAATIARQAATDLPPLAAADDLAYVIYTSGSTGRPKGVMLEHRNVVSFFAGMDHALAADRPGVWLAVTSVSFDISVLELLWTLCRGFRVVLQPELRDLGGRGTDGSVAAQVARHGVTHLQCTPSLARLVAEDPDGLAALRSVQTLLLGGEALPAELAARLLGDGDGLTLLNMYGPTETTVWSAVHRLTSPIEAPVPIGRPIANTRVYVLDGRGQPQPIGVPGELWIGGAGVARGYLGRPDLTAERFVPDPFGADPTARLYRTGDLARWRPDGVLEYLGRTDQQVKLRGFRIELGEVEAALRTHPAIHASVVVVREDRPGDPRLVAYLVGADGTTPPAPDALRLLLSERLPEYMLPAAFVTLEALPLTPNGKLDRRALPPPDGVAADVAQAYHAPQTATEELVAGIWAEVLGIERVGIRDNFFDLGGHSLLLLRVHGRLQQALERELRVVDLFRYPTVAALARHLAPDAPAPTSIATAGAARQRAVLRWGTLPEAGTADATASGGAVARAEAIAIVGMGCRFPGAASPDAFWANVQAGVESIRTFSDAELLAAGFDPRVLADPAYVKAHGVLDDVRGFDAGFFRFSAHEADLLDPQQRLFLECAWTALEQAGYAPRAGLGPVGVYAGVGPSAYQVALLANPALRGQVDGFQVQLANDKDYVATRVAYKLNLRGPAVTVQTACSTSLVAVVLACQSLLTHQCELALAGGCSVQVPETGGYLHREGGTLSADGHCRAFDADATGMVPGSGAGAVVLKRLSEALADGDTIYAVIRGAAINNDGSDKVGFTAPSVEGQAEVIATAQALAGVSPDSISYVEAHGTATALGDPIEIAGLTQAFRLGTDRTGFCALGSVKSNIGHLDTAAGVAGLIKAVQALRHRELPPTLHVTHPNPTLELETSPFYVNTELGPWPAGPTPRRAGVSSFGLGGTNAHVVLEEAPPTRRVPGSERPAELLLLGGATPTALDQAGGNLATYLGDHREAPLADVAYTLQVGRAPLPHRRAVVAGRPTDAAAALRSADPRRTVQGVAPERAPAVAFVFPGQGAQHVGMARTLYAHAPVFRAELDRCCELLEAHLGRDLRAVLFAPSGDAHAGAELRRTELAQPALFAVEYALARWWTSLGIQPQALLGHSIGEYVAACLAGVFALEDALGLVAARGRLMQALPPGSMLAVPLAEAELRSRLGPELTLAAVNGPDLCVASGPTEAVDALEARLADRGVVGTRLHTSHAFHSAMMDPILAPFADLVAQVKLAAPTLPFVSNVTGTWITPEQATDPAYWAEHLRATVRFGDGLATLLAEPSRLLLEVGPGEALTRLASRHPARRVEQATVATLPHPTDRRSDLDAALLAAGHLWTAGLPLDPTGLWPDGGRRVPLPTYPFEHRDHWIVAQAMPTADLTLLARRTDPTDWLFAPSWRRLARPSRAIGTALAESQQWLLFCDEAGLGQRLADRLRAADQRVSCVTAGTGFADLGGGAFRLDPSDRPDYDRLVDALRTGDRLPDRIVHLWSVDDGVAPDAGAPDRAVLDRGFYSLLFLSQALGERAVTGQVDLAAVSGPAHVVLGDEEVRPERAAILGPCKVLPQEYVNLTTRAIDVGHPPSEPDRLEALVGRLLGDLIGDPPPGLIAFRGPHRWVQVFEALRIEDSDDAIELRERGVYLITGGLGGIGLAIATYLAQTVRARLVLVGRSAFPAPEAWDPWLAEHSENDPTSARIRALRQIESAGGTVIVEQADVADPAQTAALVRRVLERHGVVHGAVHAAGVLHDGAAQLKTPEVAAAVLAPKVVGTLALARALEGVGCDFIALCSSVSAVLPVAGQIDYCAANAVQDAIANARAGRAGPRMIAINWDAWEDVGMWARTRSSVPRTAESQPERIRAAEGPLAFAHALATGLPQVVVSPYDFAGLMERVTRSTAVSAPTVTVPGTPIAGLGRHERPDIATPFVAPRDEREQHLAGIWQEVLGLEFVGIHDNFFDLGGDSILGIQVVARARQAGLELRPAHLFEYQTIAELAQVGNLAAPPDRATETDDAPLIDLGQQQLELILSQTDRAAQSS